VTAGKANPPAAVAQPLPEGERILMKGDYENWIEETRSSRAFHGEQWREKWMESVHID
jgi:hypothetical protein